MCQNGTVKNSNEKGIGVKSANKCHEKKTDELIQIPSKKKCLRECFVLMALITITEEKKLQNSREESLITAVFKYS